MLIWWLRLLRAWLAGVSDLCSAAALDGGATIFLQVIDQICSCFCPQTNECYKSILIVEFPPALTCNNRPFSFPLYIPMTSAALTMRHPAALRALAPRHGQIRAARLFHLVIFKDDIHSLSAFRYCLHRDAPPPLLPLFSPSCDSLMKRSPLNWKTVIKMRWVLFTSVHGGSGGVGGPAQLSWLIKS